MRLADDARNCVVYLGVSEESGFHPLGTGFLLYYGDPSCSYLVTARHVARELLDSFVIRFNNKSEEALEKHIDDPKWEYHDEIAVDIAVLEYSPPPESNCHPWPGHAIASEAKLLEKDLGAGDLAYIVGVYRLLHGKKRNLPIVHTGHVALMPGDEPIPTIDWNADNPKEAPRIEVNGYLIEVSTLPAISGAPVFVRRSLQLALGGDFSGDYEHEDTLKAWAHGTVWLLGIWHGAWMGDPSEMLAELMLPNIDDYSPQVPVNMGICMPTTRLIEILDGEALKSRRDKLKQAQDAALAVTPQAGPI